MFLFFSRAFSTIFSHLFISFFPYRFFVPLMSIQMDSFFVHSTIMSISCPFTPSLMISLSLISFGVIVFADHLSDFSLYIRDKIIDFFLVYSPEYKFISLVVGDGVVIGTFSLRDKVSGYKAVQLFLHRFIRVIEF